MHDDGRVLAAYHTPARIGTVCLRGARRVMRGGNQGETMRLWLIIAGIDGAVLILLGAYGAHNVALEPDTRRWFDMAWQYQALHAAALLAIAVGTALVGRVARLALHFAAVSFASGTVLFCGSLYRLALGGEALFPMAAPIGGSAFILGWAAIALAGLIAGRRAG